VAAGHASRAQGTQPPGVAAPPVASPAPAAASYDAEIAAAVRAAASRIPDAQVGIVVVDVDTGRVLGAHNEHAPLNPASNAKLYTAAAALATLHGDYRYQTVLAGTAKNGAVAGSLVLRGTGDPSLATDDLYAMAAELRAHGVRRVDGDILVDQQHFDEKTTPPAFEQQPNEWSAFRAPVSAVAINENTLTLSVRPSTAGNPAHIAFDPPGFVDATGTVKTGDEGADNVVLELSGAGARMNAKVSGVVSAESKLVRYTRRVENPTLLAGYALKAVLDELGVKVSGDVKAGSPKGPKAIVTHHSAPLSTLLYAVGKHSDNFYAEMIFKTLGGEKKGRPAKHADAAQVVVEWAQKNGAFDQGTVIKNGSGLFDANRVTAHGVGQLLRAAYRDPAVGPEFVAQLAVGGVDGTLHKRFRDQRARRSVRAKTGTLEDAIALSGYVLGPPGKGPIAFAIVFNHVAGHASTARLAADALVEHLAKRQY
jgi:D-alanyl-D-alanine carboxypeptidase/D-alanyl-D-alanine-endopeptidase (penicillin-binding protein 4)